MRKYIVLCCCFLLTVALYFPIPTDGYAPVSPSNKEFGYITSTYAPGIVEDDVREKWMSDFDATRYIKNDEEVLGSFRVFVRFIYDCEGYVSVYKYKIGECCNAYGWKLYENGVTCHGASVTFHIELRKGIYRIPCSVTVTCDEQGNIHHN